jgi:hypothetical protein
MQRLVQIKTNNGRLSNKQKTKIKNTPNTIYCDKIHNAYYWSTMEHPSIIIKNIFK